MYILQRAISRQYDLASKMTATGRSFLVSELETGWIPACAGMTGGLVPAAGRAKDFALVGLQERPAAYYNYC